MAVGYNTCEMTPETRELLRCPRCRGSLEASAEPKGFQCPACALSFLEVDGVPRFAGESYVASFGRQWNRYDVARDVEDEAVFRIKTGIDPPDLKGKLVLDAG